MRSTLRSLAFGLATTLAGAAMAQYPYTIYLQGTITGCYPGQTVNVQTVQNTEPAYDFDVAVDPNTCTWSAVLGVSSNPAFFTASTQCNGAVITYPGQAGFNFIQDSVIVSILMNCGGGGVYDCNNVLNGPDMPGTSCVPYPGANIVGVWSPECYCDTLSANTWDCLWVLNGPDMPGTPCDDGNPMTWGDLWSPACVCAGIDSSGVYDCLGILNGQNVPGSYCINFFGDTGVWSMNCECITNAMVYDCLGVLNGNAMPGTACDDSNPATSISFWNAQCVCVGDTASYYDCLQVINGPNVPGSPCQAFGMVGTWSAQCVCEPNNVDPCQADFWVLQALGQDSLPVPYELWVWNLSTGGNGVLTYSWDFGDGSTSTDPYPTHTYAGNGPYLLCLSIADNTGCVDTHCDSISIDEDGMYNGVLGGGGDREDGFTINVQPSSANAIAENSFQDIAAWPNPATDVLNIALDGTVRGLATVTITDLDGRVVSREQRQLMQGRNQMILPTEQLTQGMYAVRVQQGTTTRSIRFLKVD